MRAGGCVYKPVALAEVLELTWGELCGIVAHQFQQDPPSCKHAYEPGNDLMAGRWRHVGNFNVSRVIISHNEIILSL